jgi:hypothetical protein
MLTNPERTRLTLTNPAQLGSKISFLARTRWINIGPHHLQGALRQRVAEARGR